MTPSLPTRQAAPADRLPDSQPLYRQLADHYRRAIGSGVPDAHKARLVELCARAGIALIEDDPYRELADAAQPPRSLKAWDTDGTVIHCTSFNKTLAPGMRVGWINGGRWHPRIGMLKFAQSRHNEQLSQVVLARVSGDERI